MLSNNTLVNCLNRCRVKGVFENGDVIVHYLDHNFKDVVQLCNVRPLPPQYNRLPYQVSSCLLVLLTPVVVTT